MAQASRVFRVFISSTFAGLEAERDALHERDLLARRRCGRARRYRLLARERTCPATVLLLEPTSLEDAQGTVTIERIAHVERGGGS